MPEFLDGHEPNKLTKGIARLFTERKRRKEEHREKQQKVDAVIKKLGIDLMAGYTLLRPGETMNLLNSFVRLRNGERTYEVNMYSSRTEDDVDHSNRQVTLKLHFEDDPQVVNGETMYRRNCDVDINEFIPDGNDRKTGVTAHKEKEAHFRRTIVQEGRSPLSQPMTDVESIALLNEILKAQVDNEETESSFTRRKEELSTPRGESIFMNSQTSSPLPKLPIE